MDFLGDSQTFYGVLLTLIVLFQYLDEKSNFIFDIIKNTKDELGQSMKQHNLRRMYSQFKSSEEYLSLNKLLIQYSGKERKTEADEETFSKCNNLLMEISDSELSKGIEEVPQVKELDRILVKTESFTEQFRAPLYTLIYAIIVFVFDELAHFSNEHSPELLLSLGLYTLFSFLCWAVLWTMYLYNCRRIKREEENSDGNIHLDLKPFEKFMRKMNPWITYIAILTLEILIVISTLCVCNRLDVSNPATLIFTILTSSVLPSIIGIYRTIYHSDIGNYRHVLIIGHCFGLFVLSIVIVIFISWLAPTVLEPIRNHVRPSILIVKGLVFAFTIINGLIFSFVFPYFAYKRIYKSIEKKAINLENDVKSTLESFKIQIQGILSEWKPLVASF